MRLAENAGAARAFRSQNRPDLVLLDVMMGKLSGFKLAKLMRDEMGLTMPIIFITAKNFKFS